VKLTGPAIDRAMHRQRAAMDAIAVGSTTVIVDDPQLTSRLVYRQRPLIRVVFDRRGRVTPSARLFRTLDAGPVIMFVGAQAEISRNADALRAAGATVVALPESDAIETALRALAEREVSSLLVEGGPTLHRAMWDTGVVDRVQVIATPVRVGQGVAAFVPSRRGEDATRRMHGADALVEWDVHRTD